MLWKVLHELLLDEAQKVRDEAAQGEPSIENIVVDYALTAAAKLVLVAREARMYGLPSSYASEKIMSASDTLNAMEQLIDQLYREGVEETS